MFLGVGWGRVDDEDERQQGGLWHVMMGLFMTCPLLYPWASMSFLVFRKMKTESVV